MSEYNEYVTAVNKIFEYLNKMRTGWNSQDNLSHIENIEEYKRIVVSNVETFKKPAPTPKVEETSPETESNSQSEALDDTPTETTAEM